MEKVFCVSFHKTGTTSLHDYFKAAGINSCHGPKSMDGTDLKQKVDAVKHDPERVLDLLMPTISAYDAHCDVPYAGLYKSLVKRFPTSRFILITRDLSDWWSSLKTQWSLGLLNHRLTAYEFIQYRPYLGDDKEIISIADRAALIAAHERHVREATDFLSSCNFLKFDLRDSDKSERLRSFLDLTVGPEYPHSKRADSRRMFRRLKKNIRRKMLGR